MLVNLSFVQCDVQVLLNVHHFLHSVSIDLLPAICVEIVLSEDFSVLASHELKVLVADLLSQV